MLHAPALLLALALAPAPRAELVLDVGPGDTPATVLMRHMKEVRAEVGHALERTTRKRFAYRLLLRSPKVANALLHVGDRIVVHKTGLLSVWRVGKPPHLFVGPPSPSPLVGPPAPVVEKAALADETPLPPSAPAPTPASESTAPAAAPAPAPAPAPVLAVSADGLTATIDGEVLHAGPGITFFERGGTLHVVALSEPPFDLAVPVVAGAHPFALPPNAFARVSPSRTVLPASLPDSPAALVDAGQLNVHEDHLHLTARFPHGSWQKLYAARLDDSPFDPVRRQTAAVLIVKLLDVHIASDPEHFPASLTRTLALVDRAWRAFEHGTSGRDIAEMLDLDYEVSPDGHRVDVGGRTFVTAAPLRFESCTGHFHVTGDDDEHRFVAKVPLDAVFPENPFYAVYGNVVVPRPPMPRWMALVKSGELEQRRGHYHLTPRWKDPAIEALNELNAHAARLEVREAAGSALLQVLSVPLDPKDENDLVQLLGEVSKSAAAARAEIEQKAREKGWGLDLASAQ